MAADETLVAGLGVGRCLHLAHQGALFYLAYLCAVFCHVNEGGDRERPFLVLVLTSSGSFREIETERSKLQPAIWSSFGCAHYETRWLRA